ncbi:MAG: hypothetical protein JRJ85_00680 [Deltaproteobacteria bacterium]|nr:hypothetical protein [Deltaproteobacteria bacterium]
MFKRDAIGKKFGRIIKNVIKELSKQIEIISIEPDHPCPNCFFDSVSGKSSGVCSHGPELPGYFLHGNCPICHGKGVITQENKVCINAAVVWRGAGTSTSDENDLVFNDYGLEGRSIARLKTDICHLNLFKSCDYIIVENVKCTLYNPPIVRGLAGKHVLIAYVCSVNKFKDNETIKETSSF